MSPLHGARAEGAGGAVPDGHAVPVRRTRPGAHDAGRDERAGDVCAVERHHVELVARARGAEVAAGNGGVDLCSRLAGVGHDQRGASGRPVDSADRHDVRHRVRTCAGGHPGSELERGADVRAVGALQPQVCHRPAALEVQGGRGPGRGDRRVHRRVRGAGRSRTRPGGRSDEGERLVARREHRLGVRPRAELHRVVRNGADHGVPHRLARHGRAEARVRTAVVVAAVVDEPCGRRGG